MDEVRKDYSTYFRPAVGTPFSALFGRTMAQTPVRTKEQEAEVVRELRRVVGSRYLLKDVRIDDHGAYAYVLIDPSENDSMFEEVRSDLKRFNLYPRLVEAEGGGRWVIAIYPSLPRSRTNYTINLVMFLLTVFTTVWAGSILWATRSRELTGLDLFTILYSPVDVAMGAITFAFPLVLILGSHELGHYFMSRIYRVEASLPYFIPIPPIISPFGTFGALISMKENISNRRALVDIGAAGPIAGFLVAIPVTALGLALTNAFPAHSIEMVDGNLYMVINPPLLFDLLSRVLGVGSDSTIFPTALAGWIGLFVTALNLFPVGQLDGGHIVRGMFGKWAHYISYATVGLLIVLGFVTGFTTYLFFAVLIMFMGARHPPPLDDLSRVKPRQVAAFVFAVLMMVVTFHPVPIEAVRYQKDGIELFGHHSALTVDEIVPGVVAFTVLNTGASTEDVDLVIESGGERIVPTLLVQTPSVVKRLLAEGGISQASYSIGDLDLYLMDPVGQRIEKGGSADWRIVSLSRAPVSELRIDSFNVSFVSGDLIRSAIVGLSGLTDTVLLDRTMVDAFRDARIAGRIVSPSGGSDELTITMEHVGADSPYRIFFTPMNGTGTWVQPGIGSTVDVSSSASGVYTMEVMRDGGSGLIELPFTIEALLPAGEAPKDTRIDIGISTSNSTVRLFIGDLSSAL
jgi:Zn-dependent protease